MSVTTRKAGIALWVAQGLLAALFLFAGGFKLVVPIASLQMPVPLPGAFLRFVAVCEILGALGLILPGVLHIRPELTALAATGLVGIMAGATVITLVGGGGAQATLPFVVGLVAAAVAYGRRDAAAREAREAPWTAVQEREVSA